MPNTRLSMRMIREVLRLKYEAGLKNRQIARSCGISPLSVRRYLDRAARAGYRRAPEPNEVLPPEVIGTATKPAAPDPRVPDLERLHRELKRPGVTLKLLWEEYLRDRAGGYGYTQFCEHYRRWRGCPSPELRQEHKAGEKVFVDWAGQTIPMAEGPAAHLFVAVLGASGYVYAEAFADEQKTNWIQGHIQTYEFLDGVPCVTVPDNPRTAVTRACRYEPELNAAYREMATHYGTIIIPARPRRPKDKPKVESGVLQAERRILAPLRDCQFFSLGELNAAIRPLLDAINAEPFQKLPGSRRQMYEQVDRPALRPLPEHPFVMCQWKKVRVNIDYHVQLEQHYYSVPYGLVGEQLDARLSDRGVELFHGGQRVAAHMRSTQPGRCTTDPGHRPKAHQRHLEWTPSRMVEWASTVGPQCGQVVEQILREMPHPEMGYRSCLGLIRLAKLYGAERMEMGCRKALACGACSYRHIKSMLETGMEILEPDLPPVPAPQHMNIRGADYYGPEVAHAN